MSRGFIQLAWEALRRYNLVKRRAMGNDAVVTERQGITELWGYYTLGL